MGPPTYTLYYNEYSVCSIMVRYTLAVCGQALDKDSEIQIEEQPVEIFNQEQITEHFLCDINPLGQVPVLTAPSFSKPIADSLEITHYLSKYYPSLIPASHKEQINELLADLHALNYFSLSFPGRQHVAEGFRASINNKLAGDISARYRDALKYKLGVVERDKIGGLKPGVPEAMKQRTRALLERVETFLSWPPSQGEAWLFNLPHPSALDAHLTVFIARMMDVGRDEVVPDKLKQYAERVMQTKEWKSMMQGRKTMVPK